jgi:hypothetical protein
MRALIAASSLIDSVEVRAPLIEEIRGDPRPVIP